MTNHKVRQIMAVKNRARSYEEEEGMTRMLKAVRLKREQAAQQELRDDEEQRTAQ